MLRRATLLMLLLPGTALGQITGGVVTATATTQGTVGQANRADCASATTTATWNIVATGTTVGASDRWRLATGSGNTCSTTVPTTAGSSGGYIQDVAVVGATQSVTGVLVGTMATVGGVTCNGASDQQVGLCVYWLPAGSTTNAVLVSGTFNFQTAIPPAPVITGVSPGDSQLAVAVVGGTVTTTETATTGVTYTVTCSAPGATTSTATGNAGNIVCGNLTNGIAYAVSAVATSAAGNPGVSTASWPAGTDTTPLPFQDFWNTYKAAGGVEQGGCGTGGAGALAPALALAALLAARRRRP
ncbi:MAG TPA: hypothetical protein VFM45_07050 [Anaeromyxobacteraceae bacterium]|nr:hypothetical protein [Anaeromyxobacteraceae bacterium]